METGEAAVDVLTKELKDDEDTCENDGTDEDDCTDEDNDRTDGKYAVAFSEASLAPRSAIV